MQLPPDISTDLYTALGLKTQQLVVLMELYGPDELPDDDGFDPANAVLRVANRPVTFLGFSYARYIVEIGTVIRNLGEKLNNASVTLDNNDRSMASFVITNELEGMFMVLRVISGEFIAADRSDSWVAFTGKCEPVFDADN